MQSQCKCIDFVHIMRRGTQLCTTIQSCSWRASEQSCWHLYTLLSLLSVCSHHCCVPVLLRSFSQHTQFAAQNSPGNLTFQFLQMKGDIRLTRMSITFNNAMWLEWTRHAPYYNEGASLINKAQTTVSTLQKLYNSISYKHGHWCVAMSVELQHIISK